ncbi:MAG: NAD(P)-dependent oxidoreductase [Planctomycetes bacterium]|nr:NAD(P)-dependent oxidoreductase [Planctomycetota bacterium]
MTGATGFLGSHLLARLLDDGHEITILKRSTSRTGRITRLLPAVRAIDVDRQDPETAFAGARVDWVVHCATDYGRRDIEPSRICEANIVLPLRLLHLAIRHAAGGFLNTDTILDKRVSHYSLSKAQFLQWLDLHATQIDCANVALEHFYGSGDDTSKFVPHIIDALLRRADHIDLTPGEQIRHFVHVDDVVEAMCLVLATHNHATHGVDHYQVASPDGVSIRHFVETAARLSENDVTDLRFGALPYRDNEIMQPEIDLGALTRLGWSPRIGLDEGLSRTIRQERACRRGITEESVG